jgi:hypothetical protein
MTFRKGVNGERRASSLVENGEIHSYPRILLAMCVASKSFIMDFYRDHQNDESNSWDIEWFRFGSTMTLLNQLLVGVKRIANIVGQRTELWSLERFGTSQAWVLDETPIAADPSESVKVNMDSKDTGKSRLILKYLQHPSMTVPFTMYLTRRKFIGEVEFKKSTASNLNHRGSPLTPEQLNVFNADIQRVFLPGVMTCHVFRNCIVTWAEKIGKSRSFRSNLADYMQHDLKLAENVYNLFHASQVVESFAHVGSCKYLGYPAATELLLTKMNDVNAIEGGSLFDLQLDVEEEIVFVNALLWTFFYQLAPPVSGDIFDVKYCSEFQFPGDVDTSRISYCIQWLHDEIAGPVNTKHELDELRLDRAALDAVTAFMTKHHPNMPKSDLRDVFVGTGNGKITGEVFDRWYDTHFRAQKKRDLAKQGYQEKKKAKTDST